MVVIEEIDETEDVKQPATRDKTATGAADTKAKKSGLKKGFLDGAETLYPPEGSHQGEVSEDVKKARLEQETNQKLQDMTNPKQPEKGGPAGDGPECPPPPWYTPEWPKGCQYNNPACMLYEMSTSTHPSDMHEEMVRKTDRWTKAISGEEREIRLSFASMVDGDLDVLLEAVRTSEVVKELDFSHNDLRDVGVQKLVTVLADESSLPNLETVRLYNNGFTSLGMTMLTQGLAVFRPNLKLILEPPLYTYQNQTAAQ
jgi:hypothetical protein